MTGRERILATLAHHEPDRVPYDLGSTPVTSIAARAYERLAAKLGLREEVRITDQIQRLADPSEAVLQRLEVDTRGLWPRYNHTHNFKPVREGDYWVNLDEWSFKYALPADEKNAHWYSLVKHPLDQEDISVEEVDAFPWPDGGAPWRLEGLAERGRQCHEQGWLTVSRGVCAGVFEMAQRLRGTERFLMDMYANPEACHRLLDRIVEHKLAFWDRMLTELGAHLDVLAETDDIGTQDSYLISPRMYREFIKPRHKRICDLARGHSARLGRKIHVFLNSDGVNAEIMEDFIEIGVDIYNPVQFSCPGMGAAELKKRYGSALTFWGGLVDTQKTLPFGTPEQVRDEVKRQVDLLAPGGGFVACTVHNIQHEVPAENILAMREALRENGVYARGL